MLSMRDITRRKRVEQQLEVANSELASLVWKDGLTGLANRRRFDEALAQEWERCLQRGAPLSVVLLDVDHFKDYNDRYGHQQGDRSLLKVADAIANVLFRPRDLASLSRIRDRDQTKMKEREKWRRVSHKAAW